MESSIQNQRIRVPFTKEEDVKLTNLIKMYGENNWDLVSSLMQNGRTARQCRDRWVNWINLSYVKEAWSPAEDSRLIQKVEEIGPHWKAMETFFPGRVSYKLRNRFAKLQKMKKTLNDAANDEESPDQVPPPVTSPSNKDKIQNDSCGLTCKGKNTCSTCQSNPAQNQCECKSVNCNCNKCKNSCTSCKKTDKVCEKKALIFDNINDDDDQGFDWSENSWCRCINMSNVT